MNERPLTGKTNRHDELEKRIDYLGHRVNALQKLLFDYMKTNNTPETKKDFESRWKRELNKYHNAADSIHGK